MPLGELVDRIGRDLDQTANPRSSPYQPAPGPTLLGVNYLFEAATYIGQLSLAIQNEHGAALRQAGASAEAVFILGGQIAGEAFWLARAELALGYPLFRLVGFSDFGSAGELPDLGSVDPFVAVGGGISLLDGLLRADLARGVHGSGPLRWQFLLYLDALM